MGQGLRPRITRPVRPWGGAELRLQTCVARKGQGGYGAQDPEGGDSAPDPSGAAGPEQSGKMLAPFPFDPLIPQRSFLSPQLPIPWVGPSGTNPSPLPAAPQDAVMIPPLFLSLSIPTWSHGASSPLLGESEVPRSAWWMP